MMNTRRRELKNEKKCIVYCNYSVTNDVIFNKDTSKYSVPFLTELRKKSISGDRMYSEAPYTEAALMSLLGSIDTMDNGGYMDKLKGSTCVLEVFKGKDIKLFLIHIIQAYIHHSL